MDGREEPASGQQQPASDQQQPASDQQQPASDQQQPASDQQQPASDQQQPAAQPKAGQQPSECRMPGCLDKERHSMEKCAAWKGRSVEDRWSIVQVYLVLGK
jgi:hypothetical protein